ncbi:BNR repeat-containing protein [Massilia endophytica]|uniref:BNR repeat-containing protein n=1 Tax=Massilia endophytica TaxID=2899220 RepID=UPI001E3D2756|nr:BNR repeat-containing protein [Massilia endophytica]UGQ49143.1 BNR repeat-containing protein [Massilia endophytica]
MALRGISCLALAASLCACAGTVERQDGVRIVDVADGWAGNSVNAVVFRKNSLATHEGMQYIAFYDGEARVVLGKRKLGARDWELHTTQYRGNASDAHNSISIMVDGAGYLHLAWDHHNGPLRYARSTAPGALAAGPEEAMTGRDERSVSYPEFYRMPDGGLLFLYRDGGSGRGNLVVNRYDPASRTWRHLQDNLLSGEGQRNAYWQAFMDKAGTLHLSWVWRESPDVASNHDMAYARSRDGGVTWERSNGARYALPITAATAEYAARIPQRSELINQTAMAADDRGNPVIASYWRDPGSDVPQYRVLFHDGAAWHVANLGFRRAPFSLSGQGTKAIPVARPQVMVSGASAWLLFRDEERGSKASVACTADLRQGHWQVRDLAERSLGAWEPSFDTELWQRSGQLNLYLQAVHQADAEGITRAGPTRVGVLEWTPTCADNR